MKLDYRAELTTGQKRTTQMVVSAFFLLLTRKNFDDITVREICRNSLIPSSTFYNYFEDKYDVFRWAFFKYFYKFYPELHTKMNHYDLIDKDADRMYDFLQEFGPMLKKVFRKNPENGTLHQLITQCMTEIGDIIEENCTSGRDYQMPYEIVKHTYVDALRQILDQTFYGGQTFSREQLHTYMNKVFNPK